MPDGEYALGPLPVTVTRGTAAVTGTDTIAGGTATMSCLFREAMRLRRGVPGDALLDDVVNGRRLSDDLAVGEAPPHAVPETSLTPARALGRGAHDPSAGGRADVLVTAPALTPQRVMVSGTFGSGAYPMDLTHR